jgi:MFS family permease
MDWRNRIGLYGSYFLGMAGIGFILPFLPLFLAQEHVTDREISIIWTLAALSGLAQFPMGVWSDHLGRRKPFLIVMFAGLALATFLLPLVEGTFMLGLVVLFFAENGLCRATIESLSGAEATRFAATGKVGDALGALRFWRPVRSREKINWSIS